MLRMRGMRSRHSIAWLGACLALLTSVSRPALVFAQADTVSRAALPAGVPVVFGRDTLFFLKAGIGPYTPARRAGMVADRIRRTLRENLASFDSARVVDNGRSADVVVDSTVLFTVTDEDADSVQTTRLALATERARAVTTAVRQRLPSAILRVVLIGAGLTLLASVVLLLFLNGLSRLLLLAIRRIRRWRGTRIHPVRLRRFEVFSAAQIVEFLVQAARVLRVAVVLLLGYAYVSLVFSFFPWTRGFTGVLLGWVLEPLREVGLAFVQFIPNLIFILIIVAVSRLVLKAIRLVFNGIAGGRLELPNFPAEWADPTYKLVRLFVAVVALMVIFPHLPGSQSSAFKGVSVFIGLLLSLGSTAATANLVAGVVLTYMRPFRVGDRVRIADTTGDILEKTLLVTRLRTIHNEDITIPNAVVLASHIANFSSSARELGVILHTGVTIGYNAPWRKVHELLLAAAAGTEGIVREPKAYILQTSLDDFYVSYQLNAYTDQPTAMHLTYARLHENIQDAFHTAGVEIMSPKYTSIRDGNTPAIPESYLPASDGAAPFRVRTSSNK
jgi:small-conductance mechanosensitive channel